MGKSITSGTLLGSKLLDLDINELDEAQDNSFATIINLYSEKIESFTSNPLEGLQDTEILQIRIFDSQRSTDSEQVTAEAEKNLRDVLKEIDSQKKIREEGSLEEVGRYNKKIKEFLSPEHGQASQEKRD